MLHLLYQTVILIFWTNQMENKGIFVERSCNRGSIGRRKLIHGVGVNDANYMVAIKKDCKTLRCPIYSRWHGILSRCYNSIQLNRNPTYRGCFVEEDWLTFSNFRKWMKGQDWYGKVIDKDIIVKGNKKYSAETCAFVLPSTNALILDSGAIRGKYKIGVSYCKRTNRYQTLINIAGKGKGLGRFDTEVEAHNIWRIAKADQIREASQIESDPRVKQALYQRALELEVLV